MPELMTKKDAIEYLLYMKHDVQAKSPMDIALDTAIEALKQPTIEPKRGRWIPCSERLPEQGRMVIVCCYGSDVLIPDYSRGESIEEAIQRIGAIPHVTTGFCDEEGWCGADMFPMMVKPTFWMPLPEPPEKE